MDKIIEVSNLKKSYGKVKAVNGVDFYVEKGKLFAFLGPNGAGKSTVIDMICTFLKPDEGEVIIDGLKLGRDDQKIRDIIGAVFQDGVLDKLLSVESNLKIRGGLYGLSRSELAKTTKEVSEIVGIEELKKRPYGKLSGGQRRRADIARALMNKPKILFLDEPTTGLDPQTRKVVWETILKLQKDNNMTIFLTTHYMEEADVADYVVIIDQGRIKAKGTPEELKDRFSGDELSLVCKSLEDAAKVERILKKDEVDYRIKNRVIKARLESSLAAISILEASKNFIEDFQMTNGSMDNAFINITGKDLRE